MKLITDIITGAIDYGIIWTATNIDVNYSVMPFSFVPTGTELDGWIKSHDGNAWYECQVGINPIQLSGGGPYLFGYQNVELHALFGSLGLKRQTAAL
jgi:hypothetical protein